RLGRRLGRGVRRGARSRRIELAGRVRLCRCVELGPLARYRGARAPLEPSARDERPARRLRRHRPLRELSSLRPKRLVLFGAIAVLGATAGYGAWVWGRIAREFDDRHWNVPAQVYAAPVELYPGRQLSADDLALELTRLGYGPVAGRIGPGFFRRDGGTIALGRRAFVYDGLEVPAQTLEVAFAGGRIRSLEDGAGNPIAVAELEPLLIGSIFPAHGEDRIILAPEEVPELLTAALKTVEDRRFDTHWGVDARAIV